MQNCHPKNRPSKLLGLETGLLKQSFAEIQDYLRRLLISDRDILLLILDITSLHQYHIGCYLSVACWVISCTNKRIMYSLTKQRVPSSSWFKKGWSCCAALHNRHQTNLNSEITKLRFNRALIQLRDCTGTCIIKTNQYISIQHGNRASNIGRQSLSSFNQKVMRVVLRGKLVSQLARPA